MATLTQDNPFDTQPTKTTNELPTAGATTTTQAQQPAGIVASALPKPDQAMTYTPETRQVNQPTETVQGQVNSILSKDSPLMQRARTMATQQMAQRGLVNSSMAVGAGQAAMVDRALPIAQQDANTYSAVSSENMGAKNRAAEFNAGSLNQFAQQQGQQNFAATQAQLDRQQQTSLQVGQQEFAAAQQKIQNDFNMQLQTLQESGLDFRQARDIASREAMIALEQQGITNRFDQELALRSSQFNIEQYNLERRQLLQNQAELEKLGLQINANNQQIPVSFAANISNTAMSGVNAIYAQPMDAEGRPTAAERQAQAQSIVNYANSQIAWAEKFYGTAIPRVTL